MVVAYPGLRRRTLADLTSAARFQCSLPAETYPIQIARPRDVDYLNHHYVIELNLTKYNVVPLNLWVAEAFCIGAAGFE